MSNRRLTFFNAGLICMLVSSVAYSAALAGSNETAVDNIDSNFVGVVIGMIPDYYGSSNVEAAIGPTANYQIDGTERYLLLQGSTFTANVLNNANWSAGPMLDYRAARDRHVGDSLIKKMDKIAGAIESGVFLEYELPVNDKMKNYVLFHGDFEGSYNGAEGHLQVQYWQPFSEIMVAHIGLGTTYGNSKFMKKYFGITSAHDIALFPSLLGNPYNASSGIIGWNMKLGATASFSKKWLLSGSVNYEHLVGDAKRSPVVDQRGSPNQWIGSIGLSYLF